MGTEGRSHFLCYQTGPFGERLPPIKHNLPAGRFPHTRHYVLGLSEDGLTYLRHLPATGQTSPLCTTRLKNH